MKRILEAVALLQRGDRAAAREALLRLWNDLGEHGTPVERCTMAHFLADTEDNVRDELAWDLAALNAATGAAADADRDALTPDNAGFLPSLHLNVGDAYRRMGNVERARRHATYGLRRSDALPEGGYGNTTKTALRRLQARLSGES